MSAAVLFDTDQQRLRAEASPEETAALRTVAQFLESRQLPGLRDIETARRALDDLMASVKRYREQAVANGSLARVDAQDWGDTWKALALPMFLAQQFFAKTGQSQDKARVDAASADYMSLFDCNTCTAKGVCQCEFKPARAHARADGIEDHPDYRAGAEYARQHPPKGKAMPSNSNDPSYQMRRNAAVDRYRPVSGNPTPAEQAKMDAAGAEFDRREASVRQMRAGRIASTTRLDAAQEVDDEIKKKPASPEAQAAEKDLARSRARMNQRAANAWREPLDKEGQMRLDEARLLRDEDEAGGDAA